MVPTTRLSDRQAALAVRRRSNPAAAKKKKKTKTVTAAKTRAKMRNVTAAKKRNTAASKKKASPAASKGKTAVSQSMGKASPAELTPCGKHKKIEFKEVVINNKMSRSEIKAWVDQYSQPELMEAYLRSTFTPDKKIEYFYPVLATLMVKGSSSKSLQEEEYGKTYRWDYRTASVLNEDKKSARGTGLELLATSAEAVTESKHVLQLCAKGKWKDWVSIRKSSIKEAGMGLFAERYFPRMSCLGIFVGNTIHKVTEAGAKKPPRGGENNKIPKEVADNEYGVLLRNKEAKWVIAIADPNNQNAAYSMAMQYINSPMLTYNKGSRAHKRKQTRGKCNV